MLVTRGLGLNQSNPTRIVTMGLGLAGAIISAIIHAFAGVGLIETDRLDVPG